MPGAGKLLQKRSEDLHGARILAGLLPETGVVLAEQIGRQDMVSRRLILTGPEMRWKPGNPMPSSYFGSSYSTDP